MTNFDMAEFWRERGGELWVREAERYDTMLEPCGRRLLDAAALRPGERVLDVGCGNGAVTLEAARLVGPGGEVTGLDLSGPMLGLAGRRAAEQGLDIAFVQGDAGTASCPSSLSLATTCDPISPLPPITNTFMITPFPFPDELAFSAWRRPRRARTPGGPRSCRARGPVSRRVKSVA
ncbi:MAG TPA: hypothetical protein DCQ30_08160 [Acidimicrobiaceae bacterium]|nr:hypothetical protein [Acidimicrobiaceae bacterium]